MSAILHPTMYKPRLKVSEFARLAGVSMRLLRYYDQIDLFAPAHIDPYTNYRYYTLDQLPQLNQILALKDLGLSLDEIPKLLEVKPEIMHVVLQQQKKALQQLNLETEERLRRVEMNLVALEQAGRMLNVVIKKTPTWYTLSITEVFLPEQSIIPLFQKTTRVLMDARIEYQHVMSIFHDLCTTPAPAANAIEVAYLFEQVIKARPVLPDGRVMQPGAIPAFDLVASVIDTSPHKTRQYTICDLHNWVTTNGYQIAAPVREIYLRRNSSPTGENFLTEIQVPLNP